MNDIVFVRKSAFSGCLAEAHIYIDGKEYGSVSNGDSRRIGGVPNGRHSLMIKVVKNELNLDVYMDDRGTLEIPFKMFQSIKYLGKDCRVVSTSTNANRNAGLSALGWLALIVIALFIFYAASNSNNNRSSQHTSPSDENSSTVSSASSSSFSPQTQSIGDWDITLNSFSYETSISVGLLHEYRAEDGSKYCVCNISVKNTGNKSATFLSYFSDDAKLYWMEYEFTRSNLLFTSENITTISINPLVNKSGDLYFEVPDEAVNSEEPFTLTITSCDESATWTLTN